MNLPAEYLNLINGLSVIIGLIYCFLGYRIFKFILGLTGFLIGGALVGGVAYAISQQEVTGILMGVVGGALGAALLVALYFVGVFLLGAVLGGGLGFLLAALAGGSPEPAILIILAIIGGVVALFVQKFMIIVTTAFSGAFNVVIGVAYFATGAVDLTNLERFIRYGGTRLYVTLLCGLALGVAGVIVQYKSASAKDPKEEREPPNDAEYESQPASAGDLEESKNP